MATVQPLDEFHEAEEVVINLLAKNPDGTVITSPASQTITMAIGNTPYQSPPLLSWNTTPQITLSDAGTGLWIIKLGASDLATLVRGRAYWYTIWNTLSGNSKVQARGEFRLMAAVPTA